MPFSFTRTQIPIQEKKEIQPKEDKSADAGNYRLGLVCLRHPTPNHSRCSVSYITSRRLWYAAMELRLFTRTFSASCPSQCCWASSQLISHPSIKQAGRLATSNVQGQGQYKRTMGFFPCCPISGRILPFLEASHDMVRHSERPREVVSSCLKRAKWRLLRGYHGMHVAVSGGSVPGSKRANGQAVSCRERHHWPKQLPNARVVVESRVVVRGVPGRSISQPLGRHWNAAQ
ncbi:hypothetical protein ACQKWADRAFT_9140 [Trichoderma austrokoningii]